MKIKNILVSAALVAAASTACAQDKAEYVNEFQPHWYLGVQGGGQYTLGEVSFKDLLSPNAQISAGYNFTPVLGVRLGVNAWQSKGGLRGTDYKSTYNDQHVITTATTDFQRTWKYNYIAPNADLTVNLSNLLCGYNPTRVFTFGTFVGIGANIGFSNGEAQDVSNELASTYPNWKGVDGQNMGYVWDGTKVRVQGRAGVYADFRISDKWSVGLEANANVLNDHYNSKQSDNADWYFNALVGVKYNFGKTYSKRKVEAPAPQVVERVVERVVEKPAPVVAPVETVKANELALNIFFMIRSTTISREEFAKVQEIANFMKANPDTKVKVTGYADKGTGNATINSKLSQQRASMVADAIQKLGISSSRISTDYKGDTEQPFPTNNLNRVSICVVK